MRPHYRTILLTIFGLALLGEGCSLAYLPERYPGRQAAPQPLPGKQPPSPNSAYAALRIRTEPPECQVYLDGRLVGMSPLQIQNLRPGRYDVLLTLTGYKTRDFSVTLYQGKERRVDIVMQAVEHPKTVSSPD